MNRPVPFSVPIPSKEPVPSNDSPTSSFFRLLTPSEVNRPLACTSPSRRYVENSAPVERIHSDALAGMVSFSPQGNDALSWESHEASRVPIPTHVPFPEYTRLSAISRVKLPVKLYASATPSLVNVPTSEKVTSPVPWRIRDSSLSKEPLVVVKE